MTRLQKLALATLVATLVLVAIGGFARGSGSGYGCADRWPLCENGAAGGFLPRWELHMVVEWTHRGIASLVGVLALVTAVAAWRAHRGERRVVWPATIALLLLLVEAYLGRQVVKGELDADLVSMHLAVALLVVALLAWVVVNSRYARGADPAASERPDRGWTRLLAIGALGSLVLLLLGAYVHDQYVAGWPLVADRLIPHFAGSRVIEVHFVHRVVAGAGIIFLGYLAVAVTRRRRPRSEVALVYGALGCYVVEIVLGAAHVFTKVSSSGLVVAHLAVGTLVWTALVSAVVLARRHDEAAECDRRHARNAPGLALRA